MLIIEFATIEPMPSQSSLPRLSSRSGTAKNTHTHRGQATDIHLTAELALRWRGTNFIILIIGHAYSKTRGFIPLENEASSRKMSVNSFSEFFVLLS
jgi:hypothetical protein